MKFLKITPREVLSKLILLCSKTFKSSSFPWLDSQPIAKCLMCGSYYFKMVDE